MAMATIKRPIKRDVKAIGKRGRIAKGWDAPDATIVMPLIKRTPALISPLANAIKRKSLPERDKDEGHRIP